MGLMQWWEQIIDDPRLPRVTVNINNFTHFITPKHATENHAVARRFT